MEKIISSDDAKVDKIMDIKKSYPNNLMAQCF